MRTRGIIVASAIGLALTGRGVQKKQAQARADARAADFVPPSITTRLDYGSLVERRFRQLDRNGDDYLIPDELPTKDSRLMALDHNGDGKISEIEWSDGMLNRFDRMDANKDGQIDPAERFMARPVRIEPLDAERVVVAAGLTEGRRVVTQGAELIEQVR